MISLLYDIFVSYQKQTFLSKEAISITGGLHCHPERLKCTECTGKDKECGKGGTCYPDGHCEWH